MGIENWNTSYYFDSIDRDYDFVGPEEIRDYHSAKEWIEEIVYQLYEGGDVNAIENAAQELAFHFGIKFPKSEIKIELKK